MKKRISRLLVLVLTLVTVFSLAGCGSKNEEGSSEENSGAQDGAALESVTIAIPNDTTNEARALLLLEDLGLITLKEGAGITATILDIAENPHNIEFNEVEAAQLPNVLQDVDYAVINSNYAISAGLNPVKDSLFTENSLNGR